jgi:hypothetical protein
MQCGISYDKDVIDAIVNAKKCTGHQAHCYYDTEDILDSKTCRVLLDEQETPEEYKTMAQILCIHFQTQALSRIVDPLEALLN